MARSHARILAAFVAAALALGVAAERAHALTFCNPLNLDYGWSSPGYRHGADPVIVLFKDRYYLFSTWDVAGFRVSDDLVHWQSVLFPEALLPQMTDGPRRGYCAPAVAAHGDWLYFLNMRSTHLMRSRDPLSGQWEQCGTVRKASDPDLFFDEDGRLYLYYGLGGPTHACELETRTFTEIPGSDRVVRADEKAIARYHGGYERGRRELFDEVDSAPFLDRFHTLPCQEATWMTRHGGRYYLQYGTPGTVSHWYCDAVLEGDSPLGPFHEVDYGPASLKVGGFIGSAGHSCVFQDRHGNWWRVTTMWIGIHNLFERRLGLFPVRFDAQGRMVTETALGDLPQVLPDGPRGDAPPLAGWWVLSDGKACTASSSLPGHEPSLAGDENVRTWWSAATGEAGEWLQMDLGKPCRVNAVQVNFAEQDCRATALHPEEDSHRYRLLGSRDGKAWQLLVHRSRSDAAVPHDYHELPAPLSLRYLKVENVRVPCGGKFALRDLRVFGHGGGHPPAAASGLRVTRQADDDRNARFEWTPAAGARGYLVRYGVAPDALTQCVQLRGGRTRSLTLHTLVRGARYCYRVDSYSENGVTPGPVSDQRSGR